MGTKGGTTTSQNQTSTYTPTPQAAGYITNAMDKAQSAASNPFAIPQAPVAGFSGQQQQAFDAVGNAQGMAQPYYNQAASYFSPQGAQSFLNPYAANVMAGMNDVFGQQRSQNTGQLTQAAGGVGADRIAVGQAQLANQQGLAAGQTMAGLYGQAAQQAQSAGQGQMNLGNTAQTSALQGSNALLGVGGLQQQLSQAQMNSPYQQQLAQAAFPYQQAQFLAGITGALAPGLGGTTNAYGTGTSTPPAPSMWSQLLGAGTAAAGIYGGFNSGKGSGSGDAGTINLGDLGGGGFPSNVTNGSARGGRINPYAEGGGVPTDPIDISHQSLIPSVQLQPIQAHIPQANLNLNPPQQSGSGGSSAMSDIANVAKIAMMFANRGGRIDPKKFDGANPYAFADGAVPHYGDTGAPGGVVDPTADQGSFRLDSDAYGNWERGVDTDLGAGRTEQDKSGLPSIITGGTGSDPTNALAFAGSDSAAPGVPLPRARPAGAPAPDEEAPDTEDVSPYSQPSAAELGAPPKRDTGFAGSPWAALMAAGLGMMGGTSPYAGVNIGQGGMQGLKTLEAQRAAAQKDETTDQASRRLAQEAKFHNDQYTKMTAYQTAQLAQGYKPTWGVVHKDEWGNETHGWIDPNKKTITDASGKPIDTSDEGSKGVFTPTPGLPPLVERQKMPAGSSQARDEAMLDRVAEKNPGLALQIRDAANYKLDPNKVESMKGGERQRFDRMVRLFDPTFDSTFYGQKTAALKAFGSGPQGNTVRSLDVAAEHISSLRPLIQALDNGDLVAFNKFKNLIAVQQGKPEVTNFEAAAAIVGDEIVKAVMGSGGAGALADREQVQGIFKSGLSKRQLDGALDTYLGLMGGQVLGLKKQYERNTRMGNFDDEFLRPATLDAIKLAQKHNAPVFDPTAGKTDPAASSDPETLRRQAQNTIRANPKARNQVIEQLKAQNIDVTGL